jgi:tetratricopeptide (TPR) repeat protein
MPIPFNPNNPLKSRFRQKSIMKYILLISAAAAIFTACKNEPKPLDKTTTVNQLSATTVYAFDSVVAYLRQVKASQEDTSKKVFLQAIDLLKNKKDAAGSVALFEQSLRFFPNNKGYYELGNALLELNKDSQAFNAFDLAERLDYNPLGYVLFKKATAMAAMAGEDDYDKQQQALDYLKNAIENGFVSREKIFGEPRLDYIRKESSFISVYNDAMSGNGDPASILWDGYSSGFKQCSFPLIINMETLKAIKQPDAISYDYEKFVTEMRDYKFSRDVGNEFFYYAKVGSTAAFETIIYGSRGYDYGDNLPYTPAKFYIASYSKQGKLIDKLEFAGQEAFDQLFKVATLQQNLNFEIQEYQNTWAKPTTDNGYDGNTVAKSNLIKTTKYKIGANGKFVSDAKLLGFIENKVFENLQ